MIESMKVFCRVVEYNGFRAAANELDISPAMVSRHISKLEHTLKSPLLKRNTRSIALTDSGNAFYQRCKQVINMYEQCLHQASNDNQALNGHLKIGIPHSINQRYVIPSLKQFYEHYPDISLDIVVGNHSLELFSHGYDLALHCGALPDSELYYSLVGYWKKRTVASPQYLETHGIPQQPEDLEHHSCLLHFDNRQRTWIYQEHNKPFAIPVYGETRVNNSLDLTELAIAGHGLAYLPDFTVKNALESGRLISVLDQYMPAPLPMYIVHVNAQPSKREQAFIDFIKALSITE
ncbi:LysR family transcriptional regulator [Vibrio sp. CAIM 722]|uniref:LysR family transcriptional regulator n=1 Tax=Vibrio eleionomae TaxID=2653505 RepID=A0A7X4LQM0_9VIBR|nr:LysR family transcriptional regulator [Vibrio eleionomae]MZI96117.1 LysR family transcriptional regulator [Vibrio eleionomae]